MPILIGYKALDFYGKHVIGFKNSGVESLRSLSDIKDPVATALGSRTYPETSLSG
jgi:hypothetical protein